MDLPMIDLPIPVDLPEIELPYLGDLSRMEFPFLMGNPEIIPWPLNPPAMVTPEKTAGEIAIEAAQSKLGTAYNYGSTGPDAFDCSGLVQWSYQQAGVDLPRTSYAQLAAGTPVSLDDLQPGDMVSFYNGSHSALYIGDGKVIHAMTYGTGVTTSLISSMPVAGACRF
ncbi:C40 family peptidase [Nocardia sp. 004]|uniref:C40 family peptidase n=1 Tax=Nocardia sp. 004 TaxID=3385978 RepID=UPI0039A08861